MKVIIVNFKGFVKWIVTAKVIFADPLYHTELLKRITDKKI